MVSVALKNITKMYGNVPALHGVTLEIQDKEFLTILGPSGSGKTTFLRIIAGLETPTEGEIYFGDRQVNDLPARDRHVSIVFQSYALFPHMTVFDNVAFPLTIRKTDTVEVKRRVNEVAELLGISQLLERKPRELSGGEQQRVALGRAIVRSPDIFLMDEPLSSIDANMRIAMRTELKRLQKTLGTTTVYVTHDQIEAMTMADRIAVMRNGAIMQVGTPESIYNAPKNSWTAGFIGNPPMNLIDGLYSGGDRVELSGYKVHLALPLHISPRTKDLAAGSKVKLGVRPEDIEVNKEPLEGPVLSGEVYVLESLGDSTVVVVKLGDSLVKAKAKPGFKAQVGDKVHLRLDPKRMAVFDGNTGAAI